MRELYFTGGGGGLNGGGRSCLGGQRSESVTCMLTDTENRRG